MQKDVTLRLPAQKGFDENSIRKALGISKDESFIILRRSIDARRSTIMVDLSCRIDPQESNLNYIKLKEVKENSPKVIIIGSGPAGLFAAMQALELGHCPIVLERGKDVHQRRIDIAKISTSDIVNSNSNYSFGEGGAGTYSDGKLYTRSKKRGENAKVLGTFVKYGADESILYDAHPHIGTDKLPKIIENMRNDIISHGGKVLFQTLVTELVIENNKCKGVRAKNLVTSEDYYFEGPVILAIGNAARDTFKMLKEKEVAIQAKSLAMGVRLEHPQNLIDRIQYHVLDKRPSYLPAAEYSFTTQVEVDNRKMGVYSFCMCPGGFVVPAASDENQVVVNGMSPSNRGSKWANSGMVVEFPTTLLKDDSDVLGMMKLQEELEYKTYLAANKTQKAPAQRMTDFLAKRESSSLEKSSFAPGLTSTTLWDVLPIFVCRALKEGFTVFGKQAPMFITKEATMIGSETRTSSPIRIVRDSETLQSISTENLYPCGEGAGYAGGIVSAAIDGIRCAQECAKLTKNS